MMWHFYLNVFSPFIGAAAFFCGLICFLSFKDFLNKRSLDRALKITRNAERINPDKGFYPGAWHRVRK